MSWHFFMSWHFSREPRETVWWIGALVWDSGSLSRNVVSLPRNL